MNAPTAAPVFSLFKVLREPTPLSDISKHRDRSTITLNEYRLLPHVYKVITTAPSSVQAWMRSLGKRSYEQLRVLTGMSAETCEKAIRFSSTGIVPETTSRTGGPRRNWTPLSPLQSWIPSQRHTSRASLIPAGPLPIN